jgi:superfamily I DNA and/or RNA helicase
LKPGITAEDRNHGLNWCPTPVVWYSTKTYPHHLEVSVGTSFRNEAEIGIIIDLLDKIEDSYAELEKTDKSIGIITGYRANKSELQKRIAAGEYKWPHLTEIEVNTVDAYQGRERDLIIYSVVRSNQEFKIGFLRDDRRLNVALSRARELLIIVGNEDIEFAKVQGPNPFRPVIKHIRLHPDECSLGEIL